MITQDILQIIAFFIHLICFWQRFKNNFFFNRVDVFLSNLIQVYLVFFLLRDYHSPLLVYKQIEWFISDYLLALFFYFYI